VQTENRKKIVSSKKKIDFTARFFAEKFITLDDYNPLLSIKEYGRIESRGYGPRFYRTHTRWQHAIAG
jgi:hypothetical protein